MAVTVQSVNIYLLCIVESVKSHERCKEVEAIISALR